MKKLSKKPRIPKRRKPLKNKQRYYDTGEPVKPLDAKLLSVGYGITELSMILAKAVNK